jgi:hypothetical protein
MLCAVICPGTKPLAVPLFVELRSAFVEPGANLGRYGILLVPPSPLKVTRYEPLGGQAGTGTNRESQHVQVEP